jgi:hypothetical protein
LIELVRPDLGQKSAFFAEAPRNALLGVDMEQVKLSLSANERWVCRAHQFVEKKKM